MSLPRLKAMASPAISRLSVSCTRTATSWSINYQSLRPRWRVRRRSGPQMWRQHAQRGRVRRRSGPQMWRQHARPLSPRWRARRHSGPQMWRQRAPRRKQLEASALQACPQRGPILEKTILATLAILFVLRQEVVVAHQVRIHRNALTCAVAAAAERSEPSRAPCRQCLPTSDRRYGTKATPATQRERPQSQWLVLLESRPISRNPSSPSPKT